MPGSNTELIKEKLDIVEFLRGYLLLSPAGKNFKALCPFHKEKTASFMVSPERQTWHCFGCNLGGDIFTFFMRHENMEFGEALRVLAEKAGVDLKTASASDYKLAGLLYDINKEAVKFFKDGLLNSEQARKYLSERGLRQPTIEEFELGWAPLEPEALGLHLIQRGFYPEDIIRAGLAFKSERGLSMDRFRGRIMFPLHNSFGKVVGFTGRILPQFDTGEIGKYVNSPETPIFNKSKLLYGLHKTKDFIREKNEAFLVEGQMDFLMCWQAGIKNAVAASGTALGIEHLKNLKRLTDKLILSFDTDEAGFNAGERAIDLSEANDFNVRVAVLRQFKDPAEAAEKDPEGLKRTIAKAEPAQEFYFERYLSGDKIIGPLSREYLAKLRIVLAKIQNIASPVGRSLWLKELGRRTGIEEKVLFEEAEKVGSSKISQSGVIEESAVPKAQFARRELLSQYLLAIGLAKNDFGLIEESAPYLSTDCREVFEFLKEGKKAVADPHLDELMNLVMLRRGAIQEENAEDIKKFLAEEYAKERRVTLARAVKDAEMSGDEASVGSALREFHNHIGYEEKIKKEI